MYRHKGALPKGQRRGGNTVYRHTGPLSKDQKELVPQFRDTQDFDVKLRGEVGPDVQTLRTST